MEISTEKKTFELPMGFYGGVFLFGLLISLDGLITSERAISEGLFPAIRDRIFVRFSIAELWIFGLLIGLGVWRGQRGGKIDHRLAGPVLLVLGIAIGSAYEVLGKFAAGH